MATVGKQAKDEAPVPTETEVDYMADAPPARPYSEAVSDKHRAFLTENNIPLPKD
jgi:hypothetical protein